MFEITKTNLNNLLELMKGQFFFEKQYFLNFLLEASTSQFEWNYENGNWSK